ncbi:organic cation transporter protein-like [Diadema antillarum]|uniref:organic cation transporter protein-like n=1 Tax=Diadema antillarum TaxID=105358 RepID=UPI003A8AC9CF
MAFDNVLSVLGEFGIYQRRICVLVILLWFPGAANVLSIVYLSVPADHWCSVSAWDSANCTALSLSESECEDLKKRLSIPHNETEKGEPSYLQCYQYNVSGVSFQDAILEDGGDAGQYDVIPCQNGWEHDRAWSEYTIEQQFDLVCHRKYLVNLSQTIFFLGVFIGSFVFGALADRIGRKVVIFLCVGIAVVFGTAAAFSTSYVTFVVLRLVNAAACWGLIVVAPIIGTEFVGSSKRAYIGILISLGFPGGYLYLTFLAYFIRNWRYLLLALNISFVPYFFFYPLILESFRWQLSMGRLKGAELTIKQAAKINKVSLPKSTLEELQGSTSISTKEKSREPNVTDLFRTPVLRVRTLILVALWMTNNLIFYALHLSTSTFGVNVYISFVISGMLEVVAICLCVFLVDSAGRRPTCIVSVIVAGLASFAVIPSPPGPVRAAMGLVGKFAIASSWAICGIYVIEVLPTQLRSVGMGLCSTTSRVVAMATPLLLLLAELWAPAVLVMQGVVAVCIAFFLRLLPETKGKALPDTLEEGENFCRDEPPMGCMPRTRRKRQKEDSSPTSDTKV